ncbi:oligosaccharide flippase family protein [Alkalibacterium pelagium]|uniref:Membrane protein involved in the export of O-antigen and teichoic acid n=1 Tax=Alkalibacterium pelagium TaxID=426702 RepID=A0A1H7NQM4_9LACT|nr:oligosaccharide flippase family protein [Alkalibacterium pelagium]GEN51406.1 lipopolysaccharide biosynthesis protein [Alkalibacterium pelagium]SEL25579.1 Membrane protein involved in the export of O-antigen and teichoic acid [Alkalibacterium pelagium]
MPNLRRQAVDGVLWTSLRTVITSLVSPILLFVKARYLTPLEFGILAIINIFLTLINIIENFGLSTAIIQKEKVTKDESSSLFYFQILICIIIGSILILLSPLFAEIFEMKALQNLLPLLSIVIFLNGPIILFTALLEKDFHFQELSIIQIIREIFILISTTLFLIFGYGLTGVIIGQIVSVLVMVFLTFYVSFKKDLFHLRIHFRFKDVQPFLKFGAFIAFKQVMTQMTHHIDELIIGYFFSTEVLGLYHFAKNILNRLRSIITTAFSKVLFPILSKIKNDISLLTNIYNRLSKYIGVVTFPTFVGIAITANYFIPVFFGDQWIDSVVFFVILSFAYIPYMLTANLASYLLYSVNKPNLVLYTDIIVNSFYILLLLLLSWLQSEINIIVILYAAYLIVKTLTLQIITSFYLKSTFIEYLKLFKYVILATFAMSLVVLGAQSILNNTLDNMLILIISVVIGFVIYFTILYLVDRETINEMKSLILTR